MNRHQIITGAVNSGDHCYAVGTVEGVNFTAYATGSDVVILSSDFQRVQIIPGSLHGGVQVTSIDCSFDTGKIAACHGSKVYIYEPTPVFHRTSSHRLDYQWIETAVLTCESAVTCLSWNQEGTRLLTAGTLIQLWASPGGSDSKGASSTNIAGKMVSFSLGENEAGENVELEKWREIWRVKTSAPVAHISFSPDGRLFATVAKADRLVKVWYETRNVFLPKPGKLFADSDDRLEFSFVYLPHPRAVTSFSWRKTSRYMPKGSVAGMLLTSCLDNICRLWVETILPDDGVLNLQHLDPLTTQNPKYRQHRHKSRLVERLKYMKKSFKKAKTQRDSLTPMSGADGSLKREPLSGLPRPPSAHDFHKMGIHGTGVSPECHFHLAVSINADTDIPLVPLLSSGSGEPLSFVIHWLNNKDIQFTWAAEKLLHGLYKKALRTDKQEDTENFPGSPDPMEQEEDEYDEKHEEREPTTPTSTTTPKASKIKRGAFSTIRKKIRIPQAKSADYLVDEEAVSVSSSNRPSLHPQGSMMGSTAESAGSAPGDTLDREIENLVRHWHHSADLLFSIHPLDGSFLVWHVDWLDEEQPGSFRQPQVSFTSRIPSALPLGDSVTTCSNLEIYSTHTAFLDLFSMLKLSDDHKTLWQDTDFHDPEVSMISCHQNGSLNLWKINFADPSDLSTVVSVGHSGRVCGHRFQVNDMVSHPVLPLLLTTSHHNSPNIGEVLAAQKKRKISQALLNFTLGKGFCSELILWKVEPVGPLSKSGGMSELARINSGESSAFSDCAWIPTMLPSWTLGNLSTSPSACFVASDGISLRLYQVVTDATNLLTQMYSALRKPTLVRSDSNMSASSGGRSVVDETLESLNIVSLQSGSHPGCILSLDRISDAKHDWKNTQLLHIFSEHILRGKTPDVPSTKNQLEAVVDLTDLSAFEEYFYLTVLEKNPKGGSILHMWSIKISSHFGNDTTDLGADNISSGDEEEDYPANAEDHVRTPGAKLTPSNLRIQTAKVCTQPLPLPPEIEVISATPAAGHLSSAAIYPACYAPYLISTACSDGTVRFWRCHIEEGDVKTRTYFWEEWRMMLGHSSSLTVPGQILGLSCAYSARIACAYKRSVDNLRSEQSEHDNHMTVVVYECESTGGSEWVVEDKIAVRGMHMTHHFSPVIEQENTMVAIRREKKSMENITKYFHGHENYIPAGASLANIRRTVADSVILQAKQKQNVTLDWVSTEDGSHLLTIGLGSQIMVFAAVSNDIAQQNMKTLADSGIKAKRSLLRQASSFSVPVQKGFYRWMRLRMIALDSLDGAPAVPNRLSWVRTGLLVLGMDNEMYVYSQWRQGTELEESNGNTADVRDLSYHNLVKMTASPSRMKVSKTLPSLISAEFLKKSKSRKAVNQGSQNTLMQQKGINDDLVLDRGLFEAARMAAPVLPQYHPKQLTELLNFGRLRRVQAVLAHLLRFIKSFAPADLKTPDMETLANGRRASFSMSRRKSMAMSPSGEMGSAADDIQLDYLEIETVPPLPLFAIFEADIHQRKPTNTDEDYDALFQSHKDEDNLDDILGNGTDGEYDETDQPMSPRSPRSSRRSKSVLVSNEDMYAFGPRQAALLSQLLTHMHLPGLSSLDQMHLLALANTVANCTGNISIEDVQDGANGNHNAAENVDACGLRYLLAVRQHVYLMRCVPRGQRAQLQKLGIDSSYIAWAFHSENQQELLDAATNLVHGELKWSDVRELGIAWWLRSNALLKTVVEKLAKNAFQASQNPMDAALFYLAMKRKNLLTALYKLVKDQKMLEFFQNDFTEDRWRKAALKNAFALLGKQRFEHAAAFFLLGSAVKDAIDIIMSKLGDIQLALTVVRLYEGDEFGTLTHNQIQLLQDHVIEPIHDEHDHPDSGLSTAASDPFLQSISYWMLKEYAKSLHVLLEEKEFVTGDVKPSIFNFYDYLRNHPIVVRHVQSGTKANRKDAISSVERKLFFKTAHVYFRAGCPLLALEVLSKLPEFFYEDLPELALNGVDRTVNALNEKLPRIEEKASEVDWGFSPTAKNGMKEEDELKLDWGDDQDPEDDEEAEDKGSALSFGVRRKSISRPSSRTASPSRRSSAVSTGVTDLAKRTDVMAQQLKFIAGLKILMEELGTLSSGSEADGGQLRFIMYMWLEKEVEVLRLLCHKSGSALTAKLQQMKSRPIDNPDHNSVLTSSGQASLHEVMTAEKIDFDWKLQRMTRRKIWLKSNQQLLRSLVHHCQLYGGNGGLLTSVYMELALLAHELYQGTVQQQQQLLTPIPFITTLPLLSAYLTGPLTISADPVTMIANMSNDLLRTFSDRKSPPLPGDPLGPAYAARDLAVALSACVYQSLCDSDAFHAKNVDSATSALEVLAKTLINSGGYYFTQQQRSRRNTETTGRLVPTTQPSKWPGVQSLRALLARERDENSPRLYVILMEAFAAVYLTLLSTGIATRDFNLLFRLAAVSFNVKTWSSMFGGGAKKVIRTASVDRRKSLTVTPSIGSPQSDLATKTRNLLNTKVLGIGFGTSNKPPIATPAPAASDSTIGSTAFQEVFVPPETSMAEIVLRKPQLDTAANPPYVDYDSSESIDGDEEQQIDELESDEVGQRARNEHLDPNSYSWAILRLMLVKVGQRVVQQMLTTASVEQHDLPVISPVLHSTLKALDSWQDSAIRCLDEIGAAPLNLIPNTYGGYELDAARRNPYSVLLEPGNTPFQSESAAALPVKRLWNYLIHQEYLQETFVRYIFKRRKSELPSSDTLMELNSADEPVTKQSRDVIRILHKDQEMISAFASHRSNRKMVAIATSKDIYEVNIAQLLDPEGWLQDETEFSLIAMKNQILDKADPEFVVLQMPNDRPVNEVNSRMASAPLNGSFQVSTRGAYVLKGLNLPSSNNQHYANYIVGRSVMMMQKMHKRPSKEVRRLAAHPLLPYYLSGSNDGSIRVWEFGHPNPLTTVRPTQSMAKINHLDFTDQGNKFAAADADGVVSLWQLGSSSNNTAPYMSIQCHNKSCSAFAFLGSSSCIATVGHSSESRNVCLWDTLLPPKKSMVASFICHETGASTLAFASQYNYLITCGKKGDVCLFDVRQRKLQHKFQAHDSAIRAMALDPAQEYFATGAAEGDIKIWSMNPHACILNLPDEHKKQSFLRNASNGVVQLEIDPSNRLLSCGADGFFKIRQLQPADNAV